jgi:hypothetical protein
VLICPFAGVVEVSSGWKRKNGFSRSFDKIRRWSSGVDSKFSLDLEFDVGAHAVVRKREVEVG